jgi:predicted enzyme related to lactoylglutathione lyase
MAWLHAVIDVPAAQLDRAADFWGKALGWPLGEPWAGHPELRSFEPPSGRVYVHLQEVDGPPRIHLDLESEDTDSTATRAQALGAELVAERDRWRTFRSPGGFPFCVVAAGNPDPPMPVSWPDGHRTRLVQVCVDSPRDVHDAEVAFWRALLGERWAPSRSREFAGKWHDDAGSPIQLLFQRLGEETGPVRAHLDLGTDDLDADVRRLLALGAEDIGRGPGGWHALRDPAGLVFCSTKNSPEQTRHRDIG